MNLRTSTGSLVVAALGIFMLQSLRAQTITAWTFEGLSKSGINADPAPSQGSGVASTLGMTFNGSSEDSGIAGQQGTDGSNNSSSNLEWKVRGTNGWNTAAAIGTQGAEFAANTTGFSSITASFDWYPSTNGEANLMVEYTTNGTTWNLLPFSDITIPSVSTLHLLTNSTSNNTVKGAYINTTAGNTWYNAITLNFSAISAVNNDPSFGFRILNASTGADDVQATGGGPLDNSSGNWSFDDVKIAGVAIPEPGTYALILGIAVMAYIKRSRVINSARSPSKA